MLIACKDKHLEKQSNNFKHSLLLLPLILRLLYMQVSLFAYNTSSKQKALVNKTSVTVSLYH